MPRVAYQTLDAELHRAGPQWTGWRQKRISAIHGPKNYNNN